MEAKFDAAARKSFCQNPETRSRSCPLRSVPHLLNSQIVHEDASNSYDEAGIKNGASVVDEELILDVQRRAFQPPDIQHSSEDRRFMDMDLQTFDDLKPGVARGLKLCIDGS